MDAPGRCRNRARLHAHSYSQKCACDGSVDFIGRLQYHWKNNTANAIVCLFAYFVQSVCQMQIESICQLRLAPPAVSDSPYTPSRVNRGNKTRQQCDFGGSMAFKMCEPHVPCRVKTAGEVFPCPSALIRRCHKQHKLSLCLSKSPIALKM